MKQTDILGLKKPDLTDFYNVGDFNENADKIDDAVKDLKENKTNKTDFSKHTGNKENPHGVTKSQIGLGSVPNVATNDQTPTFSVASTRANIVSGEKLSVIMGKIMKFFSDLKAHAFKDLVNNLTTETTGSALDASQGKVLQEELDGVNRNLDNVSSVNASHNLFDISDEGYFMTTNNGKRIDSLSVDKNIIDYIIDSDCITINYYNTSGWVWLSKFIELPNNTDVTFTLKTTDGTAIVVGCNNLAETGVNLAGTTGSNSITFNTENYNYYFVSFYPSKSGMKYVEPQIEIGTTSTPYDLYRGKSNLNLTKEVVKQSDILYALSNGTLTNITNGYYYNNGVVVSDSNSSYGIINNLQSGNELCWENANTLTSSSPILIDFFNGDTYVSQSSVTESSGSITIPSNVTRAILSMPTTSINTIKVTSGVIAELKKDLGKQKKIYSETTINVGRQAGTTIGDNSTAEGLDTEASGASSHSEGWLSTASNECSHAEGNQTGASGAASHSEGNGTGASGDYSHAEGDTTTASGESSHAEGFNTTASGDYSHAEGNETNATSSCSHAEGYKTKAYSNSHAEGYNTTANNYSHAECYETTANGTGSHAEGNNTTAKGNYSHSEGNGTEASGSSSHSEGSWTTASGDYSHAEGNETTALRNQHAQGHYNNTSTATANSTNGTSTGTAFVIGNGTSSAKSNAFRITGEGVIYSTNSSVQTGADYAEYFEWSDENPDSEDRVGYFVTLDEDNPEKIRIANNGDYILGIVSGMPSVIGNGDECWKQRYILDEFGRYIVEEFEYEVVVGVDEETGKEIKETKIGTKWKENPDYDSTKPYIPRKERAEWSAIGMVGVLSVYDDGSCKVNGYCKVADGGIATEAEKGDGTYRVIKRVNENIVKIVLK